MAEEKVKVNLFKPVTFKGVDYQTGEVDLPAEGAANIVRKNLGEYVTATESVFSVEKEFEPLSREETWDRFTSGDDSDIVFKSLKFHQASIVEDRKRSEAERAGFNSQTEEESEKTEDPKEEPKEETKNDSTDSETENHSVITSEGIPANFPMRHIFVKLGFKSVAEIQTKTRDELIALNGVAETTADKALAFGKNQ